MIFRVHMLAFQPTPTIREVEVPQDALSEDTDRNLDQVFYFGQNEVTPMAGVCSVSVGDVIEYKEKKYVVARFGFNLMTEEQFGHYKSLERRDRSFEPILSN